MREKSVKISGAQNIRNLVQFMIIYPNRNRVKYTVNKRGICGSMERTFENNEKISLYSGCLTSVLQTLCANVVNFHNHFSLKRILSLNYFSELNAILYVL